MNTALHQIRQSRGRFFGLTTTRETFNAQFLRETDRSVIVRDRNDGNRIRRVAKANLINVNLRGA